MLAILHSSGSQWEMNQNYKTNRSTAKTNDLRTALQKMSALTS